jgi:hypothetical protein
MELAHSARYQIAPTPYDAPTPATSSRAPVLLGACHVYRPDISFKTTRWPYVDVKRLKLAVCQTIPPLFLTHTGTRGSRGRRPRASVRDGHGCRGPQQTVCDTSRCSFSLLRARFAPIQYSEKSLILIFLLVAPSVARTCRQLQLFQFTDNQTYVKAITTIEVLQPVEVHTRRPFLFGRHGIHCRARHRRNSSVSKKKHHQFVFVNFTVTCFSRWWMLTVRLRHACPPCHRLSSRTPHARTARHRTSISSWGTVSLMPTS